MNRTYKVDIHKYDDTQDLMPFINVITSYSKSLKQILEMRVSEDIWAHWIKTNDPLFINAIDPVTKVSDLMGGWLATLYGITITGECYMAPTTCPHFLRLPPLTFMVFYDELQQDLIALARKVTP